MLNICLPFQGRSFNPLACVLIEWERSPHRQECRVGEVTPNFYPSGFYPLITWLLARLHLCGLYHLQCLSLHHNTICLYHLHAIRGWASLLYAALLLMLLLDAKVCLLKQTLRPALQLLFILLSQANEYWELRVMAYNWGFSRLNSDFSCLEWYTTALFWPTACRQLYTQLPMSPLCIGRASRQSKDGLLL